MKQIKTFLCPCDEKGMIVTDEEGHIFEDAGDGYNVSFEETIDRLLAKHNLELCLSFEHTPDIYVAIKPLKKRTKAMQILKIVLTALATKVEVYVQRMLKFVEQNK